MTGTIGEANDLERVGALEEVEDIRINRELYNAYELYDDISGKSLPK